MGALARFPKSFGENGLADMDTARLEEHET